MEVISQTQGEEIQKNFELLIPTFVNWGQSQQLPDFVSFFFFLNVLFTFETKRDRALAGEGQRERVGDTESKTGPGSEPSAQSLTQGLNSQTARS